MDEHNNSLYDTKGVIHNTGIGDWNRRWLTLGVWRPAYVDTRGMLDMPFLRLAKKRCYVRRLLALLRLFGEGVYLDSLDLCCCDRQFDRFYIVQGTECSWRELDFKGSQRRNSPDTRFHGWRNLEVFPLS